MQLPDVSRTAACLACLACLSRCGNGATFYVCPDGDDAHPGTLDSPFATIARGLRAARAADRSRDRTATICLRGGRHWLSSTLRLGPEDSHTRFVAYQNEAPVLSGGRVVKGWRPAPNGLWVADFTHTSRVRSLTVNGVPALLARGPFVQGQGGWGELVVTGREPWALTPGAVEDGVRFDKSDFAAYRNPMDLELISESTTWTRQRVAVQNILEQEHHFVAMIRQPGWAFMRGSKFGRDAAKLRWQVANAVEVLDEPGEFCFDRAAGKIYYYPRTGEDMATADAVAAVCERVVEIRGTSLENRVTQVSFQGIEFSHNNFLLMDGGDAGCVTVQGVAMTCRYVADGNIHKCKYNLQRPMDAALEVASAEQIAFVDCRFVALTGVGLGLYNDTVDCRIEGCVFHNIGSAAVCLGTPQHYAVGDGMDYGPDQEGLNSGTIVRNCLVRNAAYEQIQAPGVVAYFVAGAVIEHNEISHLPYTGLSIGWWWAGTGIAPPETMRDIIVRNNYIHDAIQVLTDGGLIYTLGYASGSRMENNYLARCRGGKSNGIHPDHGASHWTIRANVVEDVGRDWIHLWHGGSHHNTVTDNFTNKESSRLRGTESQFENNTITPTAPPWDDPKAREIIGNAGLRPAYKHLLETLGPDVVRASNR